MEGLKLERLNEADADKLKTASRKFIDSGLMRSESNSLILTKEGRLLADGIAAGLFF
jgi:oxygen-independent coproporphyrinogen-3 oxidase